MTRHELIRPEDVERVSPFERLFAEWKSMPVTSIFTVISMLYFIIVCVVLLNISLYFALFFLPLSLSIIMGYKWDSFIKDDTKRRVIDYLPSIRSKTPKTSMLILPAGINGAFLMVGAVRLFPATVSVHFMVYFLLMCSCIMGFGACFGFIFIGQVLHAFQQSQSEQSRKKASTD